MAVGGQFTVQLRAILDTKGVLAQIAQIQKQAGKVMIGGAGATKGASGIAAVGKEANRTAAGVRRLNSAVDTTGKSVKRIEGKKLAKTYSEVGKGAKQATSNVKGFGATTLDVTKKVIQFGAVTAAIRGITTGMGAMVKEVFTLDSALVEFKKVSNLTSDELKDYTKQAYEAGEATAKTGVEMIEAATQFKKMGYTEDASLQLATTATMFQNIADAEISAGEAALFINSQMKAFSGEFSKYNTEGEKAQKVIDSVNEVANNYAVGTNDLQLALTKTSAAMGTFGNSFDQTLGIMTAGTEIMVGMPSQVARGWRTIAANISKVGESSKEYKDASGEVNIQMRKQNGEIKTTYEFLTDLYKGQKGVSKGWNDLNKDQRTSIALQLAGKNNQEKFLAVMNNFETAIEATKTAENSHGSAMRENARYMDSLEGKVQSLKSAWSRFSNAMLKSDTLKVVLSGLTKTMDVLASDTGASMIKFAAGLAGVGLAGKVANGMLGAVSGAIGKTSGAATKGSKGVGKLTKAFGKGGGAVGKFVGKFGKFAGLFMGTGGVWVAGIAAAAYGLYKLYKYMNKGTDTTKKYDEALQDFENTQQEYKDIAREIADLQTKSDMGEATEAEEKKLRYLKQEKQEVKERLELEREIMQLSFQDDVTKKPQDRKHKKVMDSEIAKGKDPHEAKKIADEAVKGYTELTETTEALTKANKDAGYAMSKVGEAQSKLNKARKDGDTDAERKAYEELKKYQKELDGSTKDSQKFNKTLKDQIAEWEKVYGSADKMPAEIRGSYEEAKKLSSAMDNLSSLSQGIQWDKGTGKQEWDALTQSIQKASDVLGVTIDEAGNFNNIDLRAFSAGMKSMGFEAEDVSAILQHIGEINPEATITIGNEDVAISQIKNVDQLLEAVNGEKAVADIDVDNAPAEKGTAKVKSTLEDYDGVQVDATMDIKTQGSEELTETTDNLKSQDGKTAKSTYKLNTIGEDEVLVAGNILEEQDGETAKSTYKINTKGTDDVIDATDALEEAPKNTSSKYTVTGEVDESAEDAIEATNTPSIVTKTLTLFGVDVNAGSTVETVNAQQLPPKTLLIGGKTEGSFSTAKSKYEGVPKTRSATLTVGGKVAQSLTNAISKMREALKMGGNAKGTRHAPEGLSEVNEEGWEFIRDAKTGKLRIAGGGERTVTYLNKGDAVYTHEESKKMISSKSDIKIPQHKKGKKGKAKKKAQKKYNKKYNKRKKSYENAIEDVEYKAEMEHWSDKELEDEKRRVYNAHIAALKKWNKSKAVKKLKKKGAKVKNSFGKDAYREIMTGSEGAAHDLLLRNIEKSMSNFGRGLTTDASGKTVRDNEISARDVAEREDYLKTLRDKKKISAEEYEDYLEEIRKAYLDNQMELYRIDNVSYSDMLKNLDDYVKAGKITWEDYYDYIGDLMDEQLDKETKRLEKLQKKNSDTYDLAKSWIDRKIEQLEKENEQMEEQNELIEKQNELEKARSQRVKVYRQGRGFVYEQDTQAIKEATTALKDYKKEVEKSPELQAWEKIRDLFDQAEVDAEIRNFEVLVGDTFDNLFGKYGTNEQDWLPWIKENLATRYGYENLLEDMGELNGWQAIQDFLSAEGAVEESRILEYITNNRFASGSLATPAGFARVGEQGYEIAPLGKGDSVMPHEVSENLMAWGAHSPIEYASAMANTTSNSYHFDRLVLPNVTDASSLLNELNNLPNKALQYSRSRA